MRIFSCLSLAVIAVFACGNVYGARDWKAHPAIVEINDPPENVYAVGDIHGDFDRLTGLLVGAKLILAVPDKPEAVQWTGGKAVFISTGNFIDNYSQSLKVIAMLRALQTQADKAGGQVIITLGQDEVAFLSSHGTSTKSGEFINELKAANITPAEVAGEKDSGGIGTWMYELPVAAKVGDWFFSHAGDTEGKSLTSLKSELQKQMTDTGYSAALLSHSPSLVDAKLSPHPWWEPKEAADKLNKVDSEEQADASRVARNKSSRTKSAGKDASKAEQDEQKLRGEQTDLRKEALGEKVLQKNLDELSVKHLVIGHFAGKVTFADKTSREPGHIYTEFKGVIYLIDAGLSRGAATGGKPALLHIQTGHSPVVVCADGTHASLN